MLNCRGSIDWKWTFTNDGDDGDGDGDGEVDVRDDDNDRRCQRELLSVYFEVKKSKGDRRSRALRDAVDNAVSLMRQWLVRGFVLRIVAVDCFLTALDDPEDEFNYEYETRRRACVLHLVYDDMVRELLQSYREPNADNSQEIGWFQLIVVCECVYDPDRIPLSKN